MIHPSICVRRLRGFLPVLGLLVATAASAGAQAGTATPDEFRAGDRIALTVESSAVSFADTAVVREGPVIRLQNNLGEISLAGVRRSDVERYLTQEIGKLVKDPVVHATPLVRIAVLGEVAKPGFYSIPSDVLLSDVVMLAGGPTTTSDLNKTVIRRGSRDLISEKATQSALSSGKTLDDLRLAAGDEVVIGKKSQPKGDTILRVVGIAVPLIGTIVYLSRR